VIERLLCNEVLRDMEFAQQCDLAASLGYDGLEVAPFTLGDEPHRLSDATVARVQRDVADACIGLVSLHWLLTAP
jgi:sugar phosphate isomerase/epimerase